MLHSSNSSELFSIEFRFFKGLASDSSFHTNIFPVESIEHPIIIFSKRYTAEIEELILIEALDESLELVHQMFKDGHSIDIEDAYISLCTDNHDMTRMVLELFDFMSLGDQHILGRNHHTSSIVSVPKSDPVVSMQSH